jgi:hypothetical protein
MEAVRAIVIIVGVVMALPQLSQKEAGAVVYFLSCFAITPSIPW